MITSMPLPSLFTMMGRRGSTQQRPGSAPHHTVRSIYYLHDRQTGWLGSRVVSVLDSGAERPGYKSLPRRCRVTVLGKLVTPIVPLFTK